MARIQRTGLYAAFLGSTLIVLAGCDQPLDYDLRGYGKGFSTTNTSNQITETRPQPDDRGVISYPHYQVVLARGGDTIVDVAARVGQPAAELARYNGIAMDAPLRDGEVIALPNRVAEPSAATGAITSGPIQPASGVDISTIAGDAIDRAGTTAAPAKTGAKQQTGTEPVRHKVERGETAYSIARIYNISVSSLADWNGLGTELTVREGQYLLIPVAAATAPKATETPPPGAGSVAPVPPSSTTALPADQSAAKTEKPTSPDLAKDQTASSDTAKLLMPVKGKVVGRYVKNKNEGIDISAAAGTPVKAAADGTVAAITRDTDQVPILVLRHADNLLTVYAGVDDLKIKKGDTVKRGQTIAAVRAGSPSFLHFEVRKGLESVDPLPMLN